MVKTVFGTDELVAWNGTVKDDGWWKLWYWW